MRTAALVLAVWIAACVSGAAQESRLNPDFTGGAVAAAASQGPPANGYRPITGEERFDWTVDGTIGPRSLGLGVVTSTWQTAWNIPEEWGRTWSGAGKRYFEREADVAISNTMEAGLGAIWGEDPRYIRAPPGSVKSRIGYAMKTVLLSPRRDGHLAPAWGRYVANTLNNVIENSYLPASMTTPGQTVFRCASGFLSRAAYNVWEEFWPDIKKRIRH